MCRLAVIEANSERQPVYNENVTVAVVFNGEIYERILLTDKETYLPDDELRKAHHLSMRYSLEARVPFLDHKLVDFVATGLSRPKLKRWEKKHILIKSLQGIISNTILRRRKQGFSIPLAAWLRGSLRELTHTIFSGEALRNVGLFDARTIKHMLDDHDRRARNYETQLWALLVFMLWHQMYM